MNPPLNDEGMRQAKLLAGAVALSPVSYIASSRLLRVSLHAALPVILVFPHGVQPSPYL